MRLQTSYGTGNKRRILSIYGKTLTAAGFLGSPLLRSFKKKRDIFILSSLLYVGDRGSMG